MCSKKSFDKMFVFLKKKIDIQNPLEYYKARRKWDMQKSPSVNMFQLNKPTLFTCLAKCTHSFFFSVTEMLSIEIENATCVAYRKEWKLTQLIAPSNGTFCVQHTHIDCIHATLLIRFAFSFLFLLALKAFQSYLN